MGIPVHVRISQHGLTVACIGKTNRTMHLLKGEMNYLYNIFKRFDILSNSE